MPQTKTRQIVLRDAVAADFEFVRRVHHETMKGYVKDFFGSWDGDYQDQRFARTYRPEEARIILSGGREVGWFAQRDSADDIPLTELYVAPGSQNHGIGTQILRDLISEAQGKTKTVSLGVMKNNPARRLYEREGFRAVGENEYKIFMKWLGKEPRSKG